MLILCVVEKSHSNADVSDEPAEKDVRKKKKKKKEKVYVVLKLLKGFNLFITYCCYTIIV